MDRWCSILLGGLYPGLRISLPAHNSADTYARTRMIGVSYASTHRCVSSLSRSQQGRLASPLLGCCENVF